MAGLWGLMSSHLFNVSASQDLGKYFNLIAINYLLKFNKYQTQFFLIYYNFSLIIFSLIAEDLLEDSPGIKTRLFRIKEYLFNHT